MSQDKRVIPVAGFDLPISSLLNKESQTSCARELADRDNRLKRVGQLFADLDKASLDEIPAIRKAFADFFYTDTAYQNMTRRYQAHRAADTLGGVPVEIFTPVDGAPENNQHRVLINLHGGALICGGQTYSRLESIPIAVVAKTKVIAVDYRLGPEHPFPAASDDVVSVYREVLKHHKPENIGIYGASGGGLLTAQALARFQQEGLPMPAAAGMFFGAAFYWTDGDLGYFSNAMAGLAESPAGSEVNYYLKHVDKDNPLAFPGTSPDTLAGFPPSLLLTATRDFALSSVVHTHTLLVNQGVEADLHVWEGLGHVFHMNAEMPESKEVYERVVRFFDRYLGHYPAELT